MEAPAHHVARHHTIRVGEQDVEIEIVRGVFPKAGADYYPLETKVMVKVGYGRTYLDAVQVKAIVGLLDKALLEMG